MSQHILNTVASGGCPVQVMMGWDYQMQQYFLNVEVLDDDWVPPPGSDLTPSENGYLYSNLDDDYVCPVDQQLSYYQGWAARFGILLPPSLITNVTYDRSVNRRVYKVMYQPDGSFQVVTPSPF
jgi:hypothetical protein